MTHMQLIRKCSLFKAVLSNPNTSFLESEQEQIFLVLCSFEEIIPFYFFQFFSTQCCDSNDVMCNYSTPATGVTCCEQIFVEAGMNGTLGEDQILNTTGDSLTMCNVFFLSQTVTCRFVFS